MGKRILMLNCQVMLTGFAAALGWERTILFFSDGKFVSNLRNPEFPYTTNLADIGEQEKQ